MSAIKHAFQKRSLGASRMALTSGRGKNATPQSGQVSVTALFDRAVELRLVRRNAGWFEFYSARLGQSRTQAIDFLTRNLLVAKSLQRSVLNSVLKVKPGVGTQRFKTERLSSAVPKALVRVESITVDAKQTTSEDAINELYDELANLTAEQMKHPLDDNLRRQVSSKLKQLRELQEAEADAIQQRFLGSLSVPLGTLQNLLKLKQELSVQDADPSAADEASDVAD
jgi:predicted alpha/beta-fold hydrolase